VFMGGLLNKLEVRQPSSSLPYILFDVDVI
jgi:hypothetical protein